MNVQDSIEDNRLDAEFDAKISDEWTQEDKPDSLKGRRLMRIQEQAEDAVSNENPLAANIAAVNTTLFTIAEHIGDAIKYALASEKVTVDRVTQIQPTLTQYLQLTRQIACFTAIEAAIAKAEQEAALLRSKQQRSALQHRSYDVGGRRAR